MVLLTGFAVTFDGAFTTMADPHLGHLTCRPTRFSLALSLLPQVEQAMENVMIFTPIADPSALPC